MISRQLDHAVTDRLRAERRASHRGAIAAALNLAPAALRYAGANVHTDGRASYVALTPGDQPPAALAPWRRIAITANYVIFASDWTAA